MHKKEIIFVYLPNTSHFMHFQSVRQKKGNIHNKTNKYRWYFRSKFHQTTSLSAVLDYLRQWRFPSYLRIGNDDSSTCKRRNKSYDVVKKDFEEVRVPKVKI